MGKSNVQSKMLMKGLERQLRKKRKKVNNCFDCENFNKKETYCKKYKKIISNGTAGRFHAKKCEHYKEVKD